MILFNNYDYDFNLWKKDFKEHLEINECENIDELVNDDSDVWEFIHEMERLEWEDLYTELDITIDENIIAIANIGRWNGRKSGYKKLSNNLKDILTVWSECDYIKIYTEKGNIKGIGAHHDGTNYITFKKWKKGITENAKGKVLNAIYSNAQNKETLITRYTRSIYSDIKKIYG